MPGRASRGSSSFGNRPTTSYSSPKPAPGPAPTIHVTQSNPGFFSSMVSGFGWGVGTSIARNMFSSSTPVQTSTLPNVAPAASTPILTAYDQCMKENNYDDVGCQHLKDKKSSS